MQQCTQCGEIEIMDACVKCGNTDLVQVAGDADSVVIGNAIRAVWPREEYSPLEVGERSFDAAFKVEDLLAKGRSVS